MSEYKMCSAWALDTKKVASRQTASTAADPKQTLKRYFNISLMHRDTYNSNQRDSKV